MSRNLLKWQFPGFCGNCEIRGGENLLKTKCWLTRGTQQSSWWRGPAAQPAEGRGGWHTQWAEQDVCCPHPWLLVKRLPVMWPCLSTNWWQGLGPHNRKTSYPISGEGLGHWGPLANQRHGGKGGHRSACEYGSQPHNLHEICWLLPWVR